MRLIPCQMTMDLLGLKAEDLLDGLEEPIGAATAIAEMRNAAVSLHLIPRRSRAGSPDIAEGLVVWMYVRMADEVRKTFTSMHISRNFRLFFVGQLISVAGTWVNATALAVLVLRLTDSGVALGVQSALLFLPVLLFGVLGGTFADRFDKRRILLWANVGYAVLAGLLFVLVATDVVMWMVYSISALNGLLYAIEPPTRQSFYAELVGEQHITNAVSLNSAVFTGTRVLGGAIAGTMIQAFGLWSPFFLDAVSYVAVIVALLAMRVDELHLHRRAEREPPGLARGSGTCSARPSSGSRCS